MVPSAKPELTDRFSIKQELEWLLGNAAEARPDLAITLGRILSRWRVKDDPQVEKYPTQLAMSLLDAPLDHPGVEWLIGQGASTIELISPPPPSELNMVGGEADTILEMTVLLRCLQAMGATSPTVTPRGSSAADLHVSL